MLIQRFFAPLDEVSELGLKEINMPRLGRFVALAGKNGAGKSRILSKVQQYIEFRSSGLHLVEQRRQNVQSAAENARNSPDDRSRKVWQDHLNGEVQQLTLTLERVIAAEGTGKFKAVPFVPKQLNLQDPRQWAVGELASRFRQAKSPGLSGYQEHCLFYIQQLQNRWWNAGHQDFQGTTEERRAALSEYDEFQSILTRLLGVKLSRNVDGEATLFGKPVAEAGLSDGQKVILQLCTALHAQQSSLDDSVFLLDEPENHLHPSAAIDLLKSLYESTERSQIWVATHSIPLLAYIASVDPMALWYVEDGAVSNAGRHPEMVLNSLLGNEERIGQLSLFTGLPAQLAAINYATESLSPPRTVAGGAGDPQVSQVTRVIEGVARERPLPILDFGAGKGRLLEGLAAETAGPLSDQISYFAFDPSQSDRDVCQAVIEAHFSDGVRRYSNSREDFFSHNEESQIAVVVMCNVLHEIAPRGWLDLFSSHSLIARALRDDGYLLLVEDQRIPVGEKAHEHGFIVLDTSHLRTLFCVKDEDVREQRFASDDRRGDGRLKAHLIAKPLLERVSGVSIRLSIEQLKETARENIKRLRDQPPSYANGQLNGFWTQQFANASLYLAEV